MTTHPLIERYMQFSPTSQEMSGRAATVFPGGDTRSSAHYKPYPLAIHQAQGAYLTDVDGNTLLDFMNNFTSLVHGHAHPAVVEAVQQQVARGSAYAATSLNQIELGELICSRIDSVEQLRFTSSGTEATQMAVRCARAATGRAKIMKMEGGYHGSYEQAEVSLVPLPAQRGDLATPTSLAVDASFPPNVLADTVVCPYNEPELAQQLIEQHADELAAVIVEPMLGSMGMLPATSEFLHMLRKTTAAHNIVLIFDEVITLRLAPGGAQATHGVQPDLTCMGKIIGGGLPVGAVGGRTSLMSLFHPDQKQPVMHASTFSGNALTMAAGYAALSHLKTDEISRINHLGDQLRRGFNQAFAQAGIRGCATGDGSLTNILFTDQPVSNARTALDSMIAAGPISALLHLTMLRHGVMSASRLMYCTSTAMTQDDIERCITALHESLAELRPFIETERPALMA